MHVPIFWIRQVFIKAVPAVIGVLSGTFTSLTNEARLVQSTAFSGTNMVGMGVALGVEVSAACVSPATGISAWVGVSVGGAAVVAGMSVGITVTGVACPPQAVRTIPVNKMIESAFLDMLVSFVQAHSLRNRKAFPPCLLRADE
jgi:hypothetical protein